MDSNEQIPAGSIVVGIDTTETARQALAWAIDEAVREERPLTLVHGVGNAVAAACADEGHRDVGELIGLVLREGRATLERAAAQVRAADPELRVRTVLRLCSPQQALMALADEAAMLVVGPHTRGLRTHEALSAAAELTVAADGHTIPCPVAVPGVGDSPGGGILVVVDGHAASTSTLELAFRHAARWDLPLRVVHCLADPPDGGGKVDLWLVDSTARMEAREGPSVLGFQRTVLGLMVHRLREAYPLVEVELVLADEAVDHALTTAAASMDALVLSSRHALRASEHIFQGVDPTTIRCLTVVQPVEGQASAEAEAEALMRRIEGSATQQVVDELESLYAQPAVEPRRELVPVPVRQHATRHLLRHLTHRDLG